MLPDVHSVEPGASWNAGLFGRATYDIACYPYVAPYVAGQLGFDYTAVCNAASDMFISHLPVSTCTDGCDRNDWLPYLRAFILARGCMPCLSDDPMIAKVRDLDAAKVWESEDGCIVGQVAGAFTRVLLHSQRTVPRDLAEERAAPLAMRAMQLAADCGNDVLLPVLGLSVVQVSYLIGLNLLNFSSISSEGPASLLQLQPAARPHQLILDIGMAAGDDSRYYLQQGYHVVGVEADHRAHDYVAGMLRHPNLTILHAMIAWPGNRGQSVVNETTCGSLISRFGIPYYLKVDIEGFEMACLSTLRRHSLPQFISVEVMTDESGGVGPARRLVQKMADLGYTHFKLVRQHLYHALIKYELFRDRGLPLFAGSGPFGDAAVDFRSGLAWRSVQAVSKDMPVANADLALHQEWFDVHATFYPPSA